MIKDLAIKAIKSVIDPVDEQVRIARLKRCNGCDQKTVSNLLPGIQVDVCGACSCPIETLTASKNHPKAFEGKLSKEMVETTCKHPKGSRWLAIVAMLFLAWPVFGQAFDEDYVETRSEVTDIDSLSIWGRKGNDFYRYTGTAVRDYFNNQTALIVNDSQEQEFNFAATGSTSTVSVPAIDQFRPAQVLYCGIYYNIQFGGTPTGYPNFNLTGTTLTITPALSAGEQITINYFKQ